MRSTNARYLLTTYSNAFIQLRYLNDVRDFLHAETDGVLDNWSNETVISCHGNRDIYVNKTPWDVTGPHNVYLRYTLHIHTDRQIDRQTDRQIDRQTDRQIDRHVECQRTTQRLPQVHSRQRDTDRQTDRETDRQRDRQTDRQRDRQTYRQTDRQTDR